MAAFAPVGALCPSPSPPHKEQLRHDDYDIKPDTLILAAGIVAMVDDARCAACLTCVRTCPYGIPRVDEHSHAVIDPAQCHGCGTCVSECPGKAISLKHFTDEQLIAKTAALFALA
jgi:heterodisulfide reductase subunit A